MSEEQGEKIIKLLEKIYSKLEDIESKASSIDSNTDDIYYIKSTTNDILERLK